MSSSRILLINILATGGFYIASFAAPGGTMNVYLGGVIGFLWVAGVVRWSLHRMNSAGQPDAS